MDQQEISPNVESHLQSYFGGHDIKEHQLNLPEIVEQLPAFRVWAIAPGPRMDCWTYVSNGASTIKHDEGSAIEFILVSPRDDLRLVELLTMVVWFHHLHGLDLGHTVPIGQPWLDQSRCDVMLITRPYVFEPELEICTLPDRHVHLLWLVPITRQEQQFKVDHGLEALEKEFDQSKLVFHDINRKSVV